MGRRAQGWTEERVSPELWEEGLPCPGREQRTESGFGRGTRRLSGPAEVSVRHPEGRSHHVASVPGDGAAGTRSS